MSNYALHCESCHRTNPSRQSHCCWCGEKMPVWDFDPNCSHSNDSDLEEFLELRDDNERLRHLAARFLLELSQERVRLADKIVELEAMRHTLKALYVESIFTKHTEQTINTVKMLLGLQEQPKTL